MHGVGGVEGEGLGAALGARPEQLTRRGLLVGREVVEQLGDLVVVLLLEEEPRPRHAVVVAVGPLGPEHAARNEVTFNYSFTYRVTPQVSDYILLTFDLEFHHVAYMACHFCQICS